MAHESEMELELEEELGGLGVTSTVCSRARGFSSLLQPASFRFRRAGCGSRETTST